MEVEAVSANSELARTGKDVSSSTFEDLCEGLPRAQRHIPRVGLETLDRRLAALGRGSGALRLQLGEALERLKTSGGHHKAGFSSLGAYAQERCARSTRWADDSRAMARKLEDLMLTRQALILGRLSWSMAELVSRIADPDDEDGERALLEEAATATVRQMRELVRQRRQAGSGVADEHDEHDDDCEPRRRVISRSVAQEDAWLFEGTRILIEALDGRSHGRGYMDGTVEAMLAEGLTTLQELRPDIQVGDMPEDPSETERAAAQEWHRETARWTREAEELREGSIPTEEIEPDVPDEDRCCPLAPTSDRRAAAGLEGAGRADSQAGAGARPSGPADGRGRAEAVCRQRVEEARLRFGTAVRPGARGCLPFVAEEPNDPRPADLPTTGGGNVEGR